MRILVATLLAVSLAHTPTAHSSSCQTHKCWQRVHTKRALKWCHRHENCLWKHQWLNLSVQGKYWTRCVSGKESHNRRVARESGFLSYFQWTLGTYIKAGGSNNPEFDSWYKQATLAWRWHLRHPHGQWPHTGENGVCGG